MRMLIRRKDEYTFTVQTKAKEVILMSFKATTFASLA